MFGQVGRTVVPGTPRVGYPFRRLPHLYANEVLSPSLRLTFNPSVLKSGMRRSRDVHRDPFSDGWDPEGEEDPPQPCTRQGRTSPPDKLTRHDPYRETPIMVQSFKLMNDTKNLIEQHPRGDPG